MTCPNTETWRLLNMNLIRGDQARRLREHVLQCEACRASSEEASREHERLLAAFETFGADHDQLRKQLMAMLPVNGHCVEDAMPRMRQPWPRRIAMNLRRHKLGWAAAALLPVACILLVFFLTPNKVDAFAEAVKAMREAKTMTADAFVTVTTGTDEQSDVEEIHIKIKMIRDGQVSAVWSEYKEGVLIRCLERDGKAYKWERGKVTVMDVSEQEAEQNWGPEQCLKGLLEVRESADRELGEKLINGHPATGFGIASWKIGVSPRPSEGSAVSDEGFEVRVWIDQEHGLPVLVETDWRPDEDVKISMRMENVEWNVPLDPSLFKPPSQEEIDEVFVPPSARAKARGFLGVFADAIRAMRKAKTMVADMVIETTAEKGELPGAGGPKRGMMKMYHDGQTRAVLYTMTLGGHETRSLMRDGKTYNWMGDKIQVFKTQDGGAQPPGPAQLLAGLLQAWTSPDRELGEKKINGRRAAGFEVAAWKLGWGRRPAEDDPTACGGHVVIRVWVDAERGLPILLETKQRMEMPDVTFLVESRWENIEWDVPLDPAEFEPPAEDEITETIDLMPPKPSEKDFIQGMQEWLDLKKKAQKGSELLQAKAKEKGEYTPAMIVGMREQAALDRGYPERLNAAWLSARFVARATFAQMAETLPEQAPLPEGLSEETRQQQIAALATESATASATAAVEASLRASAMGAFIENLRLEGREPEYFGAEGEPGDADAVLLRWKLDNGRRRVIYGDLRAATVD